MASKHRRRLGKFLLSSEFVDNDPYLVKSILKDMIVVRAEMLYDRLAIEYIGISDQFDLVDRGMSTPTYVANIVEHEIANEDGTESSIFRDFKGWIKSK